MDQTHATLGCHFVFYSHHFDVATNVRGHSQYHPHHYLHHFTYNHAHFIKLSDFRTVTLKRCIILPTGYHKKREHTSVILFLVHRPIFISCFLYKIIQHIKYILDLIEIDFITVIYHKIINQGIRILLFQSIFKCLHK